MKMNTHHIQAYGTQLITAVSTFIKTWEIIKLGTENSEIDTKKNTNN